MLFSRFSPVNFHLAIEATDLSFDALVFEARACKIGFCVVEKRGSELFHFVTDGCSLLVINNCIQHISHCFDELRSKRLPQRSSFPSDINSQELLVFWEVCVVHATPPQEH